MRLAPHCLPIAVCLFLVCFLIKEPLLWGRVNHLCSGLNVWVHSKQMVSFKARCLTEERIRRSNNRMKSVDRKKRVPCSVKVMQADTYSRIIRGSSSELSNVRINMSQRLNFSLSLMVIHKLIMTLTNPPFPALKLHPGSHFKPPLIHNTTL